MTEEIENKFKEKIAVIDANLLHLGLVGFAYSELWYKKVEERTKWKRKLSLKSGKEL